MATLTKTAYFFSSSLVIMLMLITSTLAHNITQILSSDPNLSQFSSYLSQTKLDDEINARQTITVLALDNAAMSSLTSNNSLSVVKNLLSLHILLDYYDPKKLHSIQNGTVLTTTLYQTTGSATSQEGSVNITDLKGGSVGFGSGLPGSKLASTYTKSIKQIPYNISVLEISAPIVAPSLLNSTSSSDANITAILDKAGCKTFATLLSTSGVLKMYQNQLEKGITIFAPTDEAFKAKGLPDLSKLTSAELVSLLQFHALTTYSPLGTLKSTKSSLVTLAPGGGKFNLSPSTSGDSVTLHTGVDSSRIAGTLLDSTPVVIYSVDSILLPVELFGVAPSPAPIESPASAPSPMESPASSPAPATESPASSPTAGSPGDSPSDSPADSPESAADEEAKKSGGRRSVPALFVVGFVGVISLIL